MNQAKLSLSPTPVTRATLPLKSIGIMRVPFGWKVRGDVLVRFSCHRDDGAVVKMGENVSRVAVNPMLCPNGRGSTLKVQSLAWQFRASTPCQLPPSQSPTAPPL